MTASQFLANTTQLGLTVSVKMNTDRAKLLSEIANDKGYANRADFIRELTDVAIKNYLNAR